MSNADYTTTATFLDLKLGETSMFRPGTLVIDAGPDMSRILASGRGFGTTGAYHAQVLTCGHYYWILGDDGNYRPCRALGLADFLLATATEWARSGYPTESSMFDMMKSLAAAAAAARYPST